MIRTAAVVLAAGRSTRYRAAGGSVATKLVAELRGEPLVGRVVAAALASQASPVIVVTGHARAEIEAALAGKAVVFAHNPAFADGLATSLRCGLAAVPSDCAGAIVLLGDMPLVTPGLIDALLDQARRNPAAQAVVPVFEGQRGNPVWLSRGLFAAASALSDDEGARRLLRDAAVHVAELPVTDAAVRLDVDEPSNLRAF